MFDKSFLQKLSEYNNKITYVKITSLDLNDFPLESIEGRCTNGSLNIEGQSSVMRTCQLTILALEEDLMKISEKESVYITDTYWAFRNKFSLEIGVENDIDPKYPKIIWFKRGVFLITSFSKSMTTNGLNISISGIDKMAMLNGKLGGQVTADHDFGTLEEEDSDGNIKIVKIPIYQIIQEGLRLWAHERVENIIIEDLDEFGWELWEYRGNEPMYMIYSIPNENNFYGQIISMTFDGNSKLFKNKNSSEKIALNDVSKYYSLNTLDPKCNEDSTTVYYGTNRKPCKVIKIKYGQTAGYHKIDLVYNTDLIITAGEPFTSVLDKINTMLGNAFEYFYNEDGQFVFRKKKNYMTELFSPINGNIIEPTMLVTPYAYEFTDLKMFSNISDSPKIDNLKNDFVVWGTSKGISGLDLNFHVRYAIDKKPTTYTAFNSIKYSVKDGWDWRELIYQMALDFYKYNEDEDFATILQNNNLWCKDGKTGYEVYYAEMQAFWRLLYNPKGDKEKYYMDKNDEMKYWNKNIHEDPSQLTFWFDFLDLGDAEVSKYEIKKIGRRTIVDNKAKPKSIYYQNTPEVQFIIGTEDTISSDMSFVPIWVSQDTRELFSRSAQGGSAISTINDLMYKHTYCSEGLNLTCMPIYHLEPNTRIYIEGKGDYLLDKISYQISHNSTMSFTCTKIIQTLI